jgi:acetylornithine deacetylase
MVLSSAPEKLKTDKLQKEAIQLLKALIRIPSYSMEENQTGDLLEHFLIRKKVQTFRKGNNVWAFNKHFHPHLPTVLLNSHHDTVKPNSGYMRDPFNPEVSSGKLFGLGSNDAGGALVSLMAAFLYFHSAENMAFNLVFAATAEEEISGPGGIESVLDQLGNVTCAIVGEPTGMQMAVAEKGLLVIDCNAKGKAGHAARDEGENALYVAQDDIHWFRNFRFPKTSPWLGPVKMSVTMIEAGKQHNMVPGTCHFTVDIRLNECYSHAEILNIIRQHIKSEVQARSERLGPSFIPPDHSLVQAGMKLGLTSYGSPTTSDQALIPSPSLKLGPGDSARSHTADEYIWLEEIREGIDIYIKLLSQILKRT